MSCNCESVVEHIVLSKVHVQWFSLQAHNRFDSLMEKHTINVSKVESFADDPSTAIQNLRVSQSWLL